LGRVHHARALADRRGGFLLQDYDTRYRKGRGGLTERRLSREKVDLLSFFLGDSVIIGFDRGVACCALKCEGGGGSRIVAIRFGCFSSLDFNEDEFPCAFYWVYNDRRLSTGDIFLRGSSIILIGPL
jgi:hypothetical protein